MGLLAAGCADSPVTTSSPFNAGSTGNQNPMDTPTGGQQMGGNNGTPPADMDGGSDLDASGGANLDAGDGSQGSTDAGPLCNVPLNAARGFHCTYINRIATGILAPADSGLPQIQGCKDFPADVSEADVTAACEDIFPALDGSIEVSSGPCDTTGAVGYCSDIFGGRDFAYHSDCDITNSAGGSGSWACDKVVPDEAGWTCIADATKSWDRGCGEVAPDAGTSESDSGSSATCDDLPTGDGDTYHCNYTNDFAGAPGCKQYTGTWTQAAATTDCNGLIQAKDGTAVFGTGPCSEEDAVGYCLNTRQDREYAYSGDCSDTSGSGKWACDNFGIVGQDASCASFVCASSEPDRKCTYASPAAGKPSCVDLPFDTTASEATTLCNGGTASEGKCSVTGAVATCTLAAGGREVYTTGLCFEHRANCTSPDAFECLVEEPVYSCHKSDNGLGCSLNPGSYTCSWCVDYRQADGWTQAAAAARCSADTANPNGGTANVVSTPKTATAESCEATRTETTRCVVEVDGKETRRYGEPNCSGTSEPVPPTVCENTGIISCRYSSTFTANNCADFETKECWTEQQVQAHCAAQQGAQANTVVVSTNNTCLAETPTADRCAAETQGKAWYAYGTPQNICTSFIDNGQFEQAPYAPY